MFCSFVFQVVVICLYCQYNTSNESSLTNKAKPPPLGVDYAPFIGVKMKETFEQKARRISTTKEQETVSVAFASRPQDGITILKVYRVGEVVKIKVSYAYGECLTQESTISVFPNGGYKEHSQKLNY